MKRRVGRGCRAARGSAPVQDGRVFLEGYSLLGLNSRSGLGVGLAALAVLEAVIASWLLRSAQMRNCCRFGHLG